MGTKNALTEPIKKKICKDGIHEMVPAEYLPGKSSV